jgi:hypothetical protein
MRGLGGVLAWIGDGAPTTSPLCASDLWRRYLRAIASHHPRAIEDRRVLQICHEIADKRGEMRRSFRQERCWVFERRSPQALSRVYGGASG